MAMATLVRPRVHPMQGYAWPVVALFTGFPVWWILGISSYIWPILAAPMLISLMVRGDVRAPKGFGVWLLFVAWMLASIVQLDEAGRVVVFLYRASLYLSITVLFLYVYNAPDPAIGAITRSLAFFGVFVVVCGFLGLLFPDASFHTPAEALLPGGLRGNQWIHDITHVRFAQTHDFLGYSISRPSAPFAYTNEWGSNYALLVPFMVAAGFGGAGRAAAGRLWRRVIPLALAVSLIPVVISVNRGLWLSLGLGLTYAAVRFAARGRVRGLLAVLAVLVVAIGVVFASPLRGVVEDRIAHGHSDRGRLSLAEQAGEGALESPLFGFGSPRPSSQNPNLPQVGTHGQIWMVLYSHGIPGAAFFLGWFLLAFWRTQRHRTQTRFWANVCVFIAFVQLPFYGLLPVGMGIMMIAAALAWREGDVVPATVGTGRRTRPLMASPVGSGSP